MKKDIMANNKGSANFGTSNDVNVNPAQQRKMEKIANQSGNRVYEWKWDKVDRVKTADETRYLFEETREVFLEELAKNPTWDECAIQHSVKERHPKFADFDDTNPYFFAAAARKDPKKPEEGSPDYEKNMYEYEKEIAELKSKRKRIYFMLSMRKQVEEGRLSQIHASQYVQAYMIQECKTEETYEQYQKRTKQAQETNNNDTQSTPATNIE